MIFETLYPHAKKWTQDGLTGEDCFVLNHCRVGVDTFQKAFEENREKAKPKTKLILPILFYGKIDKNVPGRFQGSNSGNASNNTFKRKKKDFPNQWFPWLSPGKGKMPIRDFLSLFQEFNETPGEDVCELFSLNGPLFTFDVTKKKKSDDPRILLEDMAARSVYQVVTCNKPTLAVHSVLALNALNQHAVLMEEKTDYHLIQTEMFKFCLLFWMLNFMSKLKVVDDGSSKSVQPVPIIMGVENVGDISPFPLLLDVGNFYLGMHTDKIASSHPIVQKFKSLTAENTIDRISLTAKNKVFTAPATGKAPTNSYTKFGREGALSPEIMLGVDRSVVDLVLPTYSNLIENKAFSLSRTALSYYVFPEDVSITEHYLFFLHDMIGQLNAIKTDYFNWLKKSAASKKAREDKEKALDRIQGLRKGLWAKSWHEFQVGDLLFAFEENVGSANQAQFTWTSVYRGLPGAKAFIFLEMLDDPMRFGRLSALLDRASANLSEGWKEKEIKRLVGNYFLSGRLNQIEYWTRWRSYLTRRDMSKDSVDTKLWQDAMGLIIQIKAMGELSKGIKKEWNGHTLLIKLDERRKQMDEENRSRILAYLKDLFRTEIKEPDSKSDESKKAKVKGFINRCSEDYGRFVDTESKGWETIIDGLICGWALQAICYKIRKEEPKSAIGGKSLAKYTPAQLRTLSMDLLAKAQRKGESPWNIQAPMERMFRWSQKKPHTPEVALFMDAISMGFLRFNDFHEKKDTRN